jgi:hypothetical protein
MTCLINQRTKYCVISKEKINVSENFNSKYDITNTSIYL